MDLRNLVPETDPGAGCRYLDSLNLVPEKCMLDQRTARTAFSCFVSPSARSSGRIFYLKFFLYPGGFHQWWDNFAINGYYWFVPWYA